MLLTDSDIKKFLAEGKIKIFPVPDLKEALGSCSIDLRLGYSFRVFEISKYPFIDPYKNGKNQETTREIDVEQGAFFMLHPGEFVLATTLETVSLPPDIAGRLEGRSSLGRLGIVVHSTASLVDPGFSGKIVMELGNLGKIPVALYPGMRVCALTFDQLAKEVEVPYGKKKSAKYFGQDNPVESKIGWEKETK
ncbi:dCTP deaminase [Candidatus Microgenomates bacterium]|nr:dCTP deaminase [Candidatus Microgenomates bacterium]